MRKKLAIMGVILMAIAISSSDCTQAADVRIGILDTQEVMKESKAAKKARTLLMDELNEKRSVFSKKQDEVRLLKRPSEMIKGRIGYEKIFFTASYGLVDAVALRLGGGGSPARSRRMVPRCRGDQGRGCHRACAQGI